MLDLFLNLMALQRLNEQESIHRLPQSLFGCMSEIVMYSVLPLLTEDSIFENSTNRRLLVRISVVAFLTVRKRQAREHLQLLSHIKSLYLDNVDRDALSIVWCHE